MPAGQFILSGEQIAAYHRDGYLVLRGVLSEREARVLQAECDKLLEPSPYVDPLNVRAGHRTYPGGKVMVEKLDPVHDISAVLTELVADERIVAPLRDLYMDEPLLFKDKLIFKLPGAGGYTMHQDAAFWEIFPYRDLISVMVAIDGATAENGAVELFAGYHDRFRGEPLRNFNEAEAATIEESRGQLAETEPGDLVLFSALTPHRSGPNTSDTSRKQLYLTYSPARNGQLYRAHYQHFQRYTHKTGPDNFFQ